MTDRYRLHYAPDNASLIVRLALEELGLPYDTALVDRSQNQQGSAGYLALNPNGQIPVLETPDGPLFETAAILLWLADRHGRLAPAPDNALRGPFLKWLFWASNTLQIDLRINYYPQKYIGGEPASQFNLRQGMRRRIAGHLQMLDRELAAAPGLCGGEDATLLDLYLPCLLRWVALYAQDRDNRWFDLSRTPFLHDLCARAETRASTHAAQSAEGLGPAPFTNPVLATPPEGSAT